MTAIRIVDVTDDATFAPDPAVRRPGLRPSVVRLLGGRRPRLEGRPPGLARAAAPPPPRRAPAPRRQPVRAAPRRSRAFNPFAADAPPGRPSTRSATTTTTPVDNPFAPAAADPAGRRRRRAAQARPARAGPGGLRQLREGPAGRGRRPRRTPSSGRCPPTRGRSASASCTRSCPTRRCRPSSPASRRPQRRAARATPTRLVEAVCDDLAGRGFAAVEAYPERGTRPDATSAATPEFWESAGFALAVDDERFPVVRRELA